MFYVYVLRSLKNGRFYIGCTNNLERRIFEHNS
ncbi:MAG: GIY-YIG nuclease family protein, partial [Candidatus Taylorbacteria bacterium]|nr:GIY-YIG nuclease family protein [Candidatus Taylorbacteria bacterium]